MPADFSAILRQLKRNEAAKAAKRDELFHRRKKLVYPKGYSKVTEFNFPEVSTKQLNRIKSDIRAKINNDKLKHTFLVVFLGIIGLTLVLNYVDFSRPKEIQTPGLVQDNFLSENINEFSFLIDDGDAWIKKRRWNNAIYRYEQAVRLFPHSYEANYRLALAYRYSCEFKNKDCIKGEKIVAKMLKYHPDEINLINLKVAFKTYNKK